MFTLPPLAYEFAALEPRAARHPAAGARTGVGICRPDRPRRHRNPLRKRHRVRHLREARPAQRVDAVAALVAALTTSGVRYRDADGDEAAYVVAWEVGEIRLIEAETLAQKGQALRQLSGGSPGAVTTTCGCWSTGR